MFNIILNIVRQPGWNIIKPSLAHQLPPRPIYLLRSGDNESLKHYDLLYPNGICRMIPPNLIQQEYILAVSNYRSIFQNVPVYFAKNSYVVQQGQQTLVQQQYNKKLQSQYAFDLRDTLDRYAFYMQYIIGRKIQNIDKIFLYGSKVLAMYDRYFNLEYYVYIMLFI
jgi:hypothetical protein